MDCDSGTDSGNDVDATVNSLHIDGDWIPHSRHRLTAKHPAIQKNDVAMSWNRTGKYIDSLVTPNKICKVSRGWLDGMTKYTDEQIRAIDCCL